MTKQHEGVICPLREMQIARCEIHDAFLEKAQLYEDQGSAIFETFRQSDPSYAYGMQAIYHDHARRIRSLAQSLMR